MQFDIHGDMREAPQDSHDLIVLLLPQDAQHAASVGVLEAHQVLQGPHFVLVRRTKVTARTTVPLTTNYYNLCVLVDRHSLQLPSLRCSSGGAPLQSEAAAGEEIWTPAAPARSSASASCSSLW